jgi:hypothetical protein
MKNLIKKILKEEFNDVDWWGEIPQFTPAEEFLYDLMSNLKIRESKTWKNWMLYEDENGKILMIDNINTGNKEPVLYVDDKKIWKILRNYGLGIKKTEALCVRMLEMTHKRKVLTATLRSTLLKRKAEMHDKGKTLTAIMDTYW